MARQHPNSPKGLRSVSYPQPRLACLPRQLTGMWPLWCFSFLELSGLTTKEENSPGKGQGSPHTRYALLPWISHIPCLAVDSRSEGPGIKNSFLTDYLNDSEQKSELLWASIFSPPKWGWEIALMASKVITIILRLFSFEWVKHLFSWSILYYIL